MATQKPQKADPRDRRDGQGQPPDDEHRTAGKPREADEDELEVEVDDDELDEEGEEDEDEDDEEE